MYEMYDTVFSFNISHSLEAFGHLQQATDGLISQLLNIKVFFKIQTDPQEMRESEQWA